MVSTVMLLSEFPWNGNIISWLEARDYYDQGNRLSLQHSYAQAETRYKKAVAVYPKDWRFHLVLGKALVGLRKLNAAEQELRVVVQLNPKSFEGWIELADCLANQGRDLKSAEEAARKAIALSPTNSVASAELAFILGKMGKKDEADKVLEAAASFEKDSGRFWFLSARYHWGAGDVQRAEAEFRQSSLLDLTNPECWEAEGVLLLTVKKLDESVECLKRAAKLNSHDALYQTNLGDALRLHGDIDGALVAYSRAVALEPKNPGYILNLGLIQLYAQKFAEAEETLHKAIEANPEDNRAWKAYINALDQQKKYEMAEAHLQQLLKLPKYEKTVGTWVYLGNIMYKRGNVKGAEDALNQALSLSQRDEEKQEILAIIKRLKSDPAAKSEKDSGKEKAEKNADKTSPAKNSSSAKQ